MCKCKYPDKPYSLYHFFVRTEIAIRGYRKILPSLKI